jgi:hypothetical protein
LGNCQSLRSLRIGTEALSLSAADVYGYNSAQTTGGSPEALRR